MTRRSFFNKTLHAMTRKETEAIFGPTPTPYDLTEDQVHSVDAITGALFTSDRFAELLQVAIDKTHDDIPGVEAWKVARLIVDEVRQELYAIAMTGMLTGETPDLETVDFFAAFVIGRFVADETQLVRYWNNRENSLDALEQMIAEDGEAAYRDEIESMWSFSESAHEE